MSTIVCCGLSPTVQRTLTFAGQVRPGSVNRAASVSTTASGKAANVARMIAQLGGKSHLVHPLAGETGRLVQRLLSEDGVIQSIYWMETGLTRTCTTILAGETTELVEEAPELTPDAMLAIENMLDERLRSARMLCLSGSFPRGIPTEWYAKWVARAREAGVPAMVDAQQAPLRACLSERPWLVKPNRTEAIATLGLASDASPMDAAQALLDLGAQNALVSDGPQGAIFANANTMLRVVPPALPAVNPIGSGDALAAGIAAHWVNSAVDWSDTLRSGFAAAAANCHTLTSGVVDPSTVERYRGLVAIDRVG
ncbi:MAG: 1-phosphofructokinase family hexose kinase [Armatimonadaceae bacterium]|jgi:tagatose 6-phosphate kinase